MPGTSRRRPTLEQVAAEAGVSTSTASKVLNARPNISAGTRRRVEEAMERLGYAPTTGPRAGTAVRTATVVFRTLADTYAMRVLEGVLASAREHGVEVVVDVLDVRGSERGTSGSASVGTSAGTSVGTAPGTAGGTAPLSPAWIRRQAARGRVGVVLVTSEPTAEQHRLLRAHGVAVVHVDPANPLDDSTVSVGSANFSGGVQATRHLLDLGHRRIAFAGGGPTFQPSAERLQGYLSTLRTAGVEADEALVRSRAHTFEAGVAMADELLDRTDRPTAVFAASDSIALGVLASAQRHGLRVPQDLSVVGFDDSSAAVSSVPALTTVRQPVAEMGRVALRTLLQLARGERVDSHHVELATTLVVRDSTAAPSAAPAGA
ncbi:LacI family DNA-binding transcriptional regulator [Cellulomonas carbonis]|uniref:LacI family transcriptional regulator n=1 Tax=Cellulomonas carbonis T26 TaxID=947969 RepID=A0A0A0BZQ3_9CELL|nr:substrate-binding domain-containing protein [Cellulomonas carbonis]KGM12644.1 LacI family transcriptional regulator [Cellulomonas carbonis T26]GGC06277.1 LacI family transcriptional regulator [Cellulomonas carbonis]